tara:strand:+ start:350 stop:544 length:195 start_codon:yes stop_codon:yes gene_type:complete
MKRQAPKERSGLGAIVEYLVEFEKNKISLDFCLAHAFLFFGIRESPKVDFFSSMEKKWNNIFIF